MRRALWVLGLVAPLVTGPLRAADVDPYLPNDSEIVISVNVTQLLESQLGKKHIAAALERQLKDNAQAQGVLKELGLDPLKDFSRITLATVAAAPDAGLVIVTGKFNREKIADAAAKFAADHKDKLKIHKSSGQIIYESIDENQKSTFTAFASDSTLVLSSSREQVSDVLAKSKVGSPKKELADLIKRADAKQSAWLAALPSVTAAAGGFIPPEQKATVDNIEGFLAVLKVTADAKLEVSVINKDAQSAAELAKMLNGYAGFAKLALPNAVKDNPGLAPLQDVVNTLRIIAKTKVVTLSVEMTGTQLENAIKSPSKDK
ncbi:MAG: hypothetical protein ACJ8F7_11115 [Gemmataceae bacterium]